MSNATLFCGECLQEYTAVTPCMCSRRVNEKVESVYLGTPEWPSAEESAKLRHYRTFAIGPLKQLQFEQLPAPKKLTTREVVAMLWPDLQLTEHQLKVLEQIEANPDANVVLTPHVHDERTVTVNKALLAQVLGLSNATKLPAKDWIG